MRAAALFVAVLTGSAASAVTCETVGFEGLSYSVCDVDPARDELALFLRRGDGTGLGSFAALAAERPEQTLRFAMNAGMYHPDRRPVGHYVQDGVEVMRLLTNESPGNFGLLPNGVLCLTDDSARVYETLAFAEAAPACRDATQSGPMLVIDGALHPRFLADSDSRFIRNGVGTSDAGDRAVFVISDQAVSFHEFGRFFRDGLGLPQALYFDGRISRLYAPDLGRNDAGFAMGPMIGVFE
nr:phosphodiester glycosidase family protein [Flavimaricola marinus]